MREKTLYITQGETLLELVDVTNLDFTPFDLTGYIAFAQMRREYDGVLYQDLHPIIADDPTTGVLTLNLVYLETAALLEGRWVYTVVIQNTDTQNTIPIMKGIIVVNPSTVDFLPTTTTTTTEAP